MKIMVVDDEPLINQYIVQCIRNADPESEIVGAVTSGAKALKKLEETPADLVFADITMPKMDGIELLKEIKKRDPSISVIMLTCHDDFEYARAAMQTLASNYILKNEVSVEKIRSVLRDVDRLRNERSAKGMVQQISRNQYLRRLVEQDGSVQPIQESDLRANHIYLNDRAFLVVVFQNNEQNVRILQSNLASGFENPLFYAYNSQEMYLLVNIRSEEEGGEDSSIDIIRKSEQQAGDLIGCSRVHYHLEKLQLAIAEAAADRDARFYQIPIRELSRQDGVEQTEGYIMRATIQIEEKEIDKGCAEIGRMMDYARQNYVHAPFLKESLLQLFTGIRAKMSLNLEEIEQGIEHSMRFDELQTYVNKGMGMLRKCGRMYSAPIQKAIDYIGFHFAEDISLNSVADFVYLNRDYLSRQFKKEVGVNFSEYLMSLRMKRAKQLLETTNTRISDIALQVGITNMSYFSTVFHKTFGCKPNDVRKKAKEQTMS